MDAIEIMLKEYETLRQESLTAMSSRNSILSFGLAAIAALFTASIAAPVDSNVPRPVLILVVPAVAICVVLMWLGEYERTQRAGKFLADLESKINNKAKENKLLTSEGEELLRWETQLRGESRHLKYPYIFTVALLTATGFISLYLGHNLSPVTGLMLIVVGITLAITSVYAIVRILMLQL
jgi:hypothetical protein